MRHCVQIEKHLAGIGLRCLGSGPTVPLDHLVQLCGEVAQPAGALGLVALTAIGAHAGVAVAMMVGAVALAAAAPLYLVARRPAPALVDA